MYIGLADVAPRWYSGRQLQCCPPFFSRAEQTQNCGDDSGKFEVSRIQNLSGPKVGVQHRHNHQIRPAEDALPALSRICVRVNNSQHCCSVIRLI